MTLIMPPPAPNKAIALASLADDFKSGATFSAWGIAESYGVSVRTAQRWIADVDTYLVPLEPLPGRRWRKMRRLP
jgi:predicted DNA-binding transcriptional regulator YafY